METRQSMPGLRKWFAWLAGSSAGHEVGKMNLNSEWTKLKAFQWSQVYDLVTSSPLRDIGAGFHQFFNQLHVVVSNSQMKTACSLTSSTKLVTRLHRSQNCGRLTSKFVTFDNIERHFGEAFDQHFGQFGVALWIAHDQDVQ
jgi:hypothetical protein